MPLEGIFIEPHTSTSTTPDLSLHISPPATSSTLICNINTNQPGTSCEAQNSRSNLSSRTFSQAHTELSLGRNFAAGVSVQPPHNSPYQNRLQHSNYGVSPLDVSSDGLRPIKGIPVYHSRPFPFLPADHISRDKDHHHKMYLYQHMPSSYPSFSSSCSYLCSPPSPSPYLAVAAGLDPGHPTSVLNSEANGALAAAAVYRAGTATRFNGISGDGFKSQQLHQHSQFGVGPSEMRSRFLPKLPTKRSTRAPRMRWTSTLHARFVHAVELLGGHESKDFFFFFFPSIIINFFYLTF